MDILRMRCAWHGGRAAWNHSKGSKAGICPSCEVGAGLCILAGTVGKMQYLLGMLAQMNRISRWTHRI